MNHTSATIKEHLCDGSGVPPVPLLLSSSSSAALPPPPPLPTGVLDSAVHALHTNRQAGADPTPHHTHHRSCWNCLGRANRQRGGRAVQSPWLAACRCRCRRRCWRARPAISALFLGADPTLLIYSISLTLCVFLSLCLVCPRSVSALPLSCRYGDFLKMYTSYVNNYEKSLACLTSLTDNKKFQRYCKSAALHARLIGVAVSELVSCSGMREGGNSFCSRHPALPLALARSLAFAVASFIRDTKSKGAAGGMDLMALLIMPIQVREREPREEQEREKRGRSRNREQRESKANGRREGEAASECREADARRRLSPAIASAAPC